MSFRGTRGLASSAIVRKLMSFVEDVLVLMNSKRDTKRRQDFRNIHSIAQGILTEP